MIDNPILEELYVIRAQIWKECGETTEGLFQYLRDNPDEGFPRSDLTPVKPRCRQTAHAAAHSRECKSRKRPLRSVAFA